MGWMPSLQLSEAVPHFFKLCEPLLVALDLLLELFGRRLQIIALLIVQRARQFCCLRTRTVSCQPQLLLRFTRCSAIPTQHMHSSLG